MSGNHDARNPIGQTPRSIDEGAFFRQKEDERHKAQNIEEGRKYAAEQKAKEQAREDALKRAPEAAGRRAEQTQEKGPAERMAGNGLQNTPDRMANLTPPDAKLTAAQQEMRQKREEARKADLEIATGQRKPTEPVRELPSRGR